MTKISRRQLDYSLGVIFIVIIWYIFSIFYGKPNFFPYPHQVLIQVIKLLTIEKTYLNIFNSLARTMVGFIISLIFAIILAVLSYIYTSVEYFLKPIIASLRAIPNITLIFVLFIFLGSFNSIYILMIFVALPLLYQATLGGLKNITKDLINVYLLESSNYFKGIFKIFLPLAFPYIFVGILSSFGLCLKVEIMSEILIGTTNMKGIGRQIFLAFSVEFNYLNLFAWSTLTIIILLILEYFINLFKNIIKSMN